MTNSDVTTRDPRSRPLVLARHIEDDIIHAGWPVGMTIGSESDLTVRYGVGRSVLREAIRIVEHHQVATMRRGHGGGLVVTAPDPSVIADGMAAYLEFAGTTVEQILAAKLIIEPFVASSAAHSISEHSIAVIRAELKNRLTLEVLSRDLCNTLHLVLGEVSGNSALALFVDVLNRLLVRYWNPMTYPQVTAESVAPAQHAHESVADAVMAGEADRANLLMSLHIRGIEEWYQRESSRNSAEHLDSVSSRVPAEGRSGDKLARALALKIQDEIMGLGWPVGLHFGSELDLIARYGVSRATFREAARLLEYLGVASVRMGPKGGLVVTQPEPSTATEATGLLMEFNQISAQDLHSVRLVVELGCLDLLMERPLKRREIESLEQSTPLEPRAFDDPLVCHQFHYTIAHLAGNPVLEIFLRALNAVWTRYEDGRFSRAGVQEVLSAHNSIMDAIRTNDRALARIRLQRHLEALAPWFDVRP